MAAPPGRAHSSSISHTPYGTRRGGRCGRREGHKQVRTCDKWAAAGCFFEARAHGPLTPTTVGPLRERSNQLRRCGRGARRRARPRP
jgi:hypothetical protein